MKSKNCGHRVDLYVKCQVLARSALAPLTPEGELRDRLEDMTGETYVNFIPAGGGREMIDKIIKFFIRKLVNLYYKRTHFHVYSWSIDELNEMHIQSEEVMLDKGYTRFGTKEVPHTHQRGF